MATEDGGLVCQSPAPCSLRFKAGGQRVKLEVEGEYPRKGDIRIRVSVAAPASFPLVLRIPAWAQGATLRVGQENYEAKPGTYASIHRLWEGGEEIRLVLPMEPRTKKWYHQSLAVYRGPLLYCLPIKPLWQVEGELPLGERSAAPSSPWNYALYPSKGLRQAEDGSVEVCAARVPGWTERAGSAAPPPVLPKTQGDLETLRLVPYADAPLRIAQFPQGA